MDSDADLQPTAIEVKPITTRRLTDAQFQQLADVPPEIEWFANIQNLKTRHAYQNDVQEFIHFVGIQQVSECRVVRRAHVIAWRKQLQERHLSAATIRRKLSALSSLFNHLCDRNTVEHNPVDGVARPTERANEGRTPAISDAQAALLLDAPDARTLIGKRDRAILSVFLYHGLRCEELCRLAVCDIQERRGVKHFRVHGKRDKIRYIPVHPATLQRIAEYLDATGHTQDLERTLFCSIVKGSKETGRALSGSAMYHCIVRKYAGLVGIDVGGCCTHSLRATAATNALEHEADIAKVQAWLGHASIATTCLYDKRATRAEDSPTFKVTYKL